MKNMSIRFAVAAICLAVVAACKGTEPMQHQNKHGGPHVMGTAANAAKPVNQVCPIMNGEVDPEGELAEYRGHTIGFCCDGCKPDWEALDDRDKAAFVEEALKKRGA